MKGEKFRELSTWVGNYNPSHLSCPWTDLIKLRPQTPVDGSLLASSKLTNALSRPSQSYFLPYTQKGPNFTVRKTVHHKSHQPLQIFRPNEGYRHKQEGSLQLLLNLQDRTTTSHKIIPRYITPKFSKFEITLWPLGTDGAVHHISRQPPQRSTPQKG